MNKRLNIFISYSHKGKKILQTLEKFLVNLKNSSQISVWHDEMILAGQEWDDLIKTGLQESGVITLLVSFDFQKSKYIRENKLTAAIEKHKKGQALVIPIKASSCDWEGKPYEKIQGLPHGERERTLGKLFLVLMN